MVTDFFPTREHEELEGAGPATETALIKVNPVNDPAVLALREEALKLQAYALSMVVADNGTAKMATDDLAALSKVKKAIEQKRKEWIDPISTHLAEVNQAFRQFTAPLEEADKCLRGKIQVCGIIGWCFYSGGKVKGIALTLNAKSYTYWTKYYLTGRAK